jgi:hypothetical protein
MAMATAPTAPAALLEIGGDDVVAWMALNELFNRGAIVCVSIG